MFGVTLAKRRQEMASQIEVDHNVRSAEFDYRRRITDDIEGIMRSADVFKPHGSSPSGSDVYEQNALLRRLAEDIVSYIVK